MTLPPTPMPCPSVAQWEDFLSGDTDALPWDAHLAGCADCLATLERLTALPPTPAAPDAPARHGQDVSFGRLRGLLGAADSPPAVPQADPTLPWYPGYEVRREIGRGGLGVVHEAYHLRLNRTVAIKRMKSWATATPEQLVRFNSDAKFLARLRHPSVIEIYESAIYDGQPYSVLEYVAGGSLESVVPGEPLDLRDVALFMAKVARATHYLHSHGVLHCDLKPGNVLLDVPTTSGPHRLAGRCPKIIDFGLAEYREQDVQLTRNTDVIGTPQYMAPEMLDGRNEGASVAADVYSIGAVLYELIAGHPPFTGVTRTQVIRSARAGRAAAPTSSRGERAPSLDAICLRCLDLDPAKRFPNAAAVADALMAESSIIDQATLPRGARGLGEQLDLARTTLDAARQLVESAAVTPDRAKAEQMLTRARAVAATLSDPPAAPETVQ